MIFNFGKKPMYHYLMRYKKNIFLVVERTFINTKIVKQKKLQIKFPRLK